MSEPDAASSCGVAQALTALPISIVSSASSTLSPSFFSATISSESRTINTLYSPSTIFVGIAPLTVITWVALIASPEVQVALPRLWSTQVCPESTLRITSAMKESVNSKVPSLITVMSKGTTSPGFAASPKLTLSIARFGVGTL